MDSNSANKKDMLGVQNNQAMVLQVTFFAPMMMVKTSNSTQLFVLVAASTLLTILPLV